MVISDTKTHFMASQQATTAIFIDKYHPKAGGRCAISVRVTFDRKKKSYPPGISLPLADYGKVIGQKPREPFKGIALRLQAFEKKAADIIKILPVFTWKSFEKHF